jgi:arginase
MVSVIGIPWDKNSSFMKGPALAPTKIREAFESDSSNYFTESGVDLKNHPQWMDAGDVAFSSNEHFSKSISDYVSRQLNQNQQVLSLGGDHSITFPVVESFYKKYGALNILHLDAHPDLYEDFEGNPYSHASPFARILEKKWAKRLVQVGIRTMNTHQREQAKRYNVEVIEMKNFNSQFNLQFDGPIYLSLDMDAIDPAFAPGVSHHEPGGFTTREVLNLLHRLEGNFVGADLVEFNPTRDGQNITAMLAGKLLKELLDLLLRSSSSNSR